MIAFFPRIYPDELLYSQLTRYHVRSGYASYTSTAEDLFVKERLRVPNVEFVNHYTSDCRSWLTKFESWDEIVSAYTMAYAYIRFLPKPRRITAMKGLISCEWNWRQMNILTSRDGSSKRYLRYCPECAKEDRAKYGETFWHRAHQIQRVRVCSKHRCCLENSDVIMGHNGTTRLRDAESHVPKDGEFRGCEDEKELEFTQYVMDVMKEPLDLEGSLPIGKFLHSKLGSEYVSESGLVRNTGRLHQDYVKFFDGMPVMNVTYLDEIFDGRYFDVYFILQIAFFLGLSVEEITKLPADIPLLGLEGLYVKMAQTYNIDIKVIGEIGKTVMTYYNQTKV